MQAVVKDCQGKISNSNPNSSNVTSVHSSQSTTEKTSKKNSKKKMADGRLVGWSKVPGVRKYIVQKNHPPARNDLWGQKIK